MNETKSDKEIFIQIIAFFKNRKPSWKWGLFCVILFVVEFALIHYIIFIDSSPKYVGLFIVYAILFFASLIIRDYAKDSNDKEWVKRHDK